MSRPKSPKISVVVTTLNEGSHLRRTIRHLRATLPARGEIVVVDDGSTDGSSDFLVKGKNGVRLLRSDHLGPGRARNLGARQAAGDFLVFLDAHTSMRPGWWAPIAKMLSRSSVGAVAPVVSDMVDSDCKGYGLNWTGPDLNVEWLDCKGARPYRVPLLPGGCWAMRRDVFDATGGFDDGMVGWGSEDNEFSLRLWLLGYELWVLPAVEISHVFREEGAYDVDWRWALHNRLRLAFLHFDGERIARVVEALRDQGDFPSALALVVDSDMATRRRELASRRVRDARWFFETFGPSW